MGALSHCTAIRVNTRIVMGPPVKRSSQFKPRVDKIDVCNLFTGLHGLLHTRYAVACSLFASLGGLTFGYDQGVISNILVMRDFVHRFPLSPFQVGLLSASRRLPSTDVVT